MSKSIQSDWFAYSNWLYVPYVLYGTYVAHYFLMFPRLTLYRTYIYCISMGNIFIYCTLYFRHIRIHVPVSVHTYSCFRTHSYNFYIGCCAAVPTTRSLAMVPKPVLPMMASRNLMNWDPWRGFVKKSPIISWVGQYITFISSLLILSL